MKIAIIALLLTKRNMNIDTRHPTKIVKNFSNSGFNFFSFMLYFCIVSPLLISCQTKTSPTPMNHNYFENLSPEEKRVIVKSFPFAKTFAGVSSHGEGVSRIGHEFTVRVYEPDANRDSDNEDRINLTELEFRGERGIKTTLANPKFDANMKNLKNILYKS